MSNTAVDASGKDIETAAFDEIVQRLLRSIRAKSLRCHKLAKQVTVAVI